VQELSYQHPMVERAFQVKASFACLSLLRVMHEAVRCYGSDLEAFVIYLAVACASSGGAWRRPELILTSKPWPPSEVSLRPVSRRAIAASTGLPREKVRRKIALMVEAGFLVEEKRGVRIRGTVFDERQNTEFTASLVRELERAAGELARVDRVIETAGLV
jgi:hypothetical protein